MVDADAIEVVATNASGWASSRSLKAWLQAADSSTTFGQTAKQLKLAAGYQQQKDGCLGGLMQHTLYI